MKIKALAPWFGAKRNLAPRIVEVLGPHRVYWEPFCGSMAVLLAKEPCRMETVNDLHLDLTNLARVIQHETEGPRLYERLHRTLMAEELYKESAAVARAEYDGTLDTDRAYHYFMSTWMGRNGVAGTERYNYSFCVRFTAHGGSPSTRWQSAINSIPKWHTRLANVTILRRNAFDLLPRIDDDANAAIYVDPPYLVKGKGYIHDFADEDHKRLATELQRFQHARVVVSYYDHPLLGKLYPGWQREDIVVPKALAHQGRRGKNSTKATEVLLVNELMDRPRTAMRAGRDSHG